MKRLIVCLAVLAASAFARAQSPCRPLASVVVPQVSYARVNAPAFEGRLYLYAPDIKASLGGRFEPFTLWIVEGVYGTPFTQDSGPLDEGTFERIRSSRNVVATPVTVDGGGRRTPFRVGSRQLSLEIARVNTSLGGADSVAVNVCQ